MTTADEIRKIARPHLARAYRRGEQAALRRVVEEGAVKVAAIPSICIKCGHDPMRAEFQGADDDHRR